MQDTIKAYLVAIAGAAGISTWKLIQRYWRILTLLSTSLVALMSISVITSKALVVPFSGSISATLVGDTVICSSGDVAWSAQHVELEPHIVTQICIAS
jgi:hypothetical protein